MTRGRRRYDDVTSEPRHPLVERYLADLQRHAASTLPPAQREELFAEISSHVDAGARAARSEADIRNMLDDLGHPLDIVNAAAPPRTDGGPTGQLAVVLGVIAVVLILVPPVGIPVGAIAVILGLRARRHSRGLGSINRMATSAVALGAVAVALRVLLLIGLVSSGSDADTEAPTENTILGG